MTIEEIKKAILLDLGNSELWIELGASLIEVPSHHTEAEEAFRKAISLDPDSFYSWNSLGILLSEYPSRHAKAEEAFRKAISLDPDSFYPWHGLGILLSGYPSRHTEAEEAFRKAISLDPDSFYSWHGLGNLLSGYPSRHAKAEEAFRKAISLEPNYSYPWHGLGNLLSGYPSRHAKAEEAFRKAIFLDPDSFYPWHGLGNLLFKYPSRHTEAEEAFKKAISLDPNIPNPWYKLGILYDFYNRQKLANDAFNSCLTIEKEFIFAWFFYILKSINGDINYSFPFQNDFFNKNQLYYSFAVAALIKTTTFLESNEKYSVLSRNISTIIKILDDEPLPFLYLRIFNIESIDQALFPVSEKLRTRFSKLIELISIARYKNDILFESVIWFIGGDPIKSFYLLDTNETDEDATNFKYQYYLYQSALNYFNEEAESVLNNFIYNIESHEWIEDKDSSNNYYAALLLLICSTKFETQKDKLLLAKNIIKPLIKEESCIFLYVLICIELEDFEEIADDIDNIILLKKKREGVRRLFSKTAVFSDAECTELNRKNIDSILHWYELAPFIANLNNFSDYQASRFQKTISDTKSIGNIKATRSVDPFMETSAILQKITNEFYEKTSLFNPFDFWELRYEESESKYINQQIKEWLILAEQKLLTNINFKNILKTSRPPNEFDILLFSISSKKELNFYNLLFDYLRLKKQIRIEERYCLKIQANICYWENCLKGTKISQRQIENTIKSLLSYTLLGNSDLLTSFDVFDAGIKGIVIDKLNELVVSKFLNKDFEEITYKKLIDTYDSSLAKDLLENHSEDKGN